MVTRVVTDKATGTMTTPADYSQLGLLLIMATLIIVTMPLAAILLVQNSRFKTQQ